MGALAQAHSNAADHRAGPDDAFVEKLVMSELGFERAKGG
jgi:hypothetical protein